MSFRDDAKEEKIFSRRVFVLGGIQFCLLGTMAGRLAYLQVSQGQKYRTLAEQNRINIRLTAPSRGQIVDRFGVPLAINNQNFRVQVIPEQTENLERALRGLQKLIFIPERNIQDVLKRSERSPSFVPLEVKDNLSWEEVSKIEINVPTLPGLSIDIGEQRTYPFGYSTAHLVGYVGAPDQDDVKEDVTLRLPGFKVGKLGIEKQYDKAMRGEPGAREVEVNVKGREVRVLKTKESTPGKRIVLTIDAELQRFAQNILAREQSASAVVMDAKTGAVYALVSSPAYDPNEFSKGIPKAMWQELLSDPKHPLINKAVAGQYPPGSTFKMITALAAFKTGKITSEITHFCPGHFDLGRGRFHCWKDEGHGHMNVVEALSQSCDVFFYKICNDVGMRNIAKVARDFGLGQTYDFDLTEERAGLVPDPDWKLGYYGEPWGAGETVNASIGQGYMLTTPLQLAVMQARLVNGGHAVKPWITGGVGSKSLEQTEWPKLDYHDWHLSIIQKGMERAVNDARGTAIRSQIQQPFLKMGGKTGTAQVKRITKAERAAGIKNEDLPWKFRHHALFTGYAPIGDPRYVCSVVVEHGVGGSKAAAPLAKELLLEVQRRDPARSPLNILKDPEEA